MHKKTEQDDDGDVEQINYYIDGIGGGRLSGGSVSVAVHLSGELCATRPLATVRGGTPSPPSSPTTCSRLDGVISVVPAVFSDVGLYNQIADYAGTHFVLPIVWASSRTLWQLVRAPARMWCQMARHAHFQQEVIAYRAHAEIEHHELEREIREGERRQALARRHQEFEREIRE